MEKVIVTGALQLIGFHLCNRLLNKGIYVVGIDTFANNEKIKAEMLLSIGRNANFDFVDVELSSFNYDDNFHETDVFFHLQTEPTTDVELKKIISSCEKYNVPIVFISSLDVYGRSNACYNEDSELKPLTALGKRKKSEEAMLLERKTIGKNKLLIFRTPYVFGPWQAKNECLHKLLYSHIKHSSELIIKASFAKRYMFVDDVVEAIMLAVNRDFESDIFNLSVNEERFSNKKVKKQLSFQPRYTFEEGLEMQKQHLLKVLATNPTVFENM